MMTYDQAEMIVKCLVAVQKNPKNKNAASYLSAFTREEVEFALDWVAKRKKGEA
jgi:hypothetical protein